MMTHLFYFIVNDIFKLQSNIKIEKEKSEKTLKKIYFPKLYNNPPVL